MEERGMQLPKRDVAYYRACEDAKEDYHYMRITRTQEQVEKAAERYRRLEANIDDRGQPSETT